MLAQWTATTPSVAVATLGDDSQRWAIQIEQIGAQCVEQVEPLAFGAAQFRAPRGNVAGDCVLRIAKSHATRAAALTFFMAEVARLGQQGTLVLTQDGTTMTMALASLRGVTMAQIEGLRWHLRYTFGITTIV